jgi:hypothetical protein
LVAEIVSEIGQIQLEGRVHYLIVVDQLVVGGID